MKHETLARQIFKISDTKDKVICPPEQVFASENFVISVTMGGHYVVWGDEEYQKLMTLLKEIGETEFYILGFHMAQECMANGENSHIIEDMDITHLIFLM